MTAAGRYILSALLVLAPGFCSSQSAANRQQEIELHAQKAQEYLREKKPELAIPELKALVALDPENADARGNLGVLLYFRGQYPDAVPHLREAVRLRPELWKIRALLGLAEARTKEYSASRADLEAAYPHLDDEKIQIEAGETLLDEYTATDDLEKAAALVSTLVALKPTDPALLYSEYRIYSDVAGKAMLALALTHPASAEMHQVMARELARHGDYDAAIANYREALRINPRLPGLHAELGDLLFHSEDEKLRAQAGAEFEAAAAENPEDGKSQLMLGILAEQKGDMKAAQAYDARAVQLEPDNADACTELAKVLVVQGQKQEALKLLEHAIAVDPTNAVAHYRLAALYREQGRTDEAKQQVQAYLQYKQMKDKLQKIFQDMRVLSRRPAVSEDPDQKP